MHHFKSFSRVKSTQDEKMGFTKEYDLKLIQVELLSFSFFKKELLIYLFLLFLFSFESEHQEKIYLMNKATIPLQKSYHLGDITKFDAGKVCKQSAQLQKIL